MSIYSNVTEQELKNLRKIGAQQKNQRALKIEKRILKQTLDVKLAESLSPITEKLNEVNEPTKKLGAFFEKSRPENNIPQPAIEHTQHHQPIANTLQNKKNNTGSFQKYADKEHGWMWKGQPVKMLGGTEVEIKKNIK